MLGHKRVLLGVTGGIAAYKAAELASRLVKEGAEVQVVMTEAACRFVSPLTFAALTGHPVLTDMFPASGEVTHIETASRAEVVAVVPATANFIAKMTMGMADDLLTAIILATSAPVVVAPAMNCQMYAKPVVQENLYKLRQRGVTVIEPGVGRLACGAEGPGRLADLDLILAHMALACSPRRDLGGKRVLVTAGGTREPLDPVRYVGNRSSGKMGYAMAQAAVERGAEVTLVSTVQHLPVPPMVTEVKVETAAEMLDVVLDRFPETDIVVKAAAVADYRPAETVNRKLKRGTGDLVITLQPNPDILAELGRRKTHQVLVGFAAETEDIVQNAAEKMRRKGVDMIVANDVTAPGAGFGADTNIVTVITADGRVEELPCLPKIVVAHKIYDLLTCTNQQ